MNISMFIEHRIRAKHLSNEQAPNSAWKAKEDCSIITKVLVYYNLPERRSCLAAQRLEPYADHAFIYDLIIWTLEAVMFWWSNC